MKLSQEEKKGEHKNMTQFHTKSTVNMLLAL